MLIQADARQIPLKSGSVQCVVASPPYWGLRSYGAGEREIGLERTLQEYVACLVEVFREIRRVLRDDGTLWLNLGDSYARDAAKGQHKPGDSGKQGYIYDKGGGRASATLFPSAGGLKPKDLIGIPWAVAFALRDDGWYLRSDIIWSKCLSGGTRVYAKTQKGEMPTTIKDLVRLDPTTVKLWDGEKWNQVHSWQETKPNANRKKIALKRRQRKHRTGIAGPIDSDLEFEFRNGERIGCTKTHKWPTANGLVESSQLVVGDVVLRTVLPEPQDAIEASRLDDEEIGWFVGIYLAEGSKSGDTLQFAGHINETKRNDRLACIARNYHGTCTVQKTGGNSISANIQGAVLHGVINHYVAGSNAHDKHLQPRCWQRCNRFLRALMVGYLEGDGGKRAGNQWRLGFTLNDSLAADLRTIGGRLNASVRLRRRVATNTKTGKRHKCWMGDFRWSHEERRTRDGQIVAIRQSRARKFWNISLVEAPHIFALSSGICTANSNPMPESVIDRPTKSHEYVFLLTKSQKYFYDQEAVREDGAGRMDFGRMNRPEARLGGSGWSRDNGNKHEDEIGRNLRSVWTISTEAFGGEHFATFPRALVEICIKAGTSEKGACVRCGAPWERIVEKSGGTTGRSWHDHKNDLVLGQRDTDRNIANGYESNYRVRVLGWQPTCKCGIQETKPCLVFDPFVGSGATVMVARGLGRTGIGSDLKYFDLSKSRIHGPLFASTVNA